MISSRLAPGFGVSYFGGGIERLKKQPNRGTIVHIHVYCVSSMPVCFILESHQDTNSGKVKLDFGLPYLNQPHQKLRAIDFRDFRNYQPHYFHFSTTQQIPVRG